jgi:hypothetical protein
MKRFIATLAAAVLLCAAALVATTETTQKWNGSAWVIVARSESATSSETISYFVSSGYYRWQIYSYSGSGSYNFWRLSP